MSLFVFGFGYTARAVVARMRPALDPMWGTTRDVEKVSELEALGVAPVLFDGGLHASPLSASPPQGGRERTTSPPLRGGDRERGKPLLDALARASQVLVSIAPDEGGDPVLNQHREDLAAAKPKCIVYLSTVGVYGDYDGAWVDETSECHPVSRRSVQRLAAENAWREFSTETGVPVAIIRLAGIYGPGRAPFEKIRSGTARRVMMPGQVFNRIHVEDITTIVAAAFERRADGIFNGSDDEPAPPEDVLAYAAELLGLPPPPIVPFEEAELTPMARSFYGESKRVRNDRVKRDLGVAFTFPTYREGLKAIADDEARR